MDGETGGRRWGVPRSCDAILAGVHSWDEFVAAAERLGTGKEANKKKGDLFERLVINAALFPRGIDVVLVADENIVAIPRTTRLVAKGD